MRVWQKLPVGATETDVQKSAPSSDRAAVAPNNNNVFYASVESHDPVIRGLLQKRIRLYIRGRIEYNDINGHGHTTTFCAYYPTSQPLPNFFNCGSGNMMN